MTQPIPANVETIYQDIRQLIEAAKGQVVSQINQTLVLTYWQIGKRIKTEVLQDERAQYGAGIIKQLAAQLTREYGNGFSHSSLTRMAKFYAYLPEQAIVATLSQQLSWSHFVELLKLDNPVKRNFYIGICGSSRWSVRTLRERIDSMLFEHSHRQTTRRSSAKRGGRVTAQSGRYPAIVSQRPVPARFSGSEGQFHRKNLENAILMELRQDRIPVSEYWLQLPSKRYYKPNCIKPCTNTENLARIIL